MFSLVERESLFGVYTRGGGSFIYPHISLASLCMGCVGTLYVVCPGYVSDFVRVVTGVVSYIAYCATFYLGCVWLGGVRSMTLRPLSCI